MSEISNDKNLTATFTKKSHHNNISVFLITQNIFHQSKEMRNVSLNSHYIVLMKAPRDKMQIYALGRQAFPNKQKFFAHAYEFATSLPYGHLIIDMTSTSPDYLRLRQRKVIKGQKGFEIYTEKR